MYCEEYLEENGPFKGTADLQKMINAIAAEIEDSIQEENFKKRVLAEIE